MINDADVIGKKFGKLTVLRRSGCDDKLFNSWLCRCDCGEEVLRFCETVPEHHSACLRCKKKKQGSYIEHGTWLLGRRFGRLTVINYKGRDSNSNHLWEYQCDCGTITTVRATSLIMGQTQSCGCLTIERAREASTKHGLHKHPLYAIWHQMRERCYNPKCKAYKNYGARNIVICKNWLEDFLNFYNWAMENGYEKDLSIDRKDVNGNYEPNNCRWATPSEQSQNTRRTKIKPDQLEAIRQDTRSNAKIAKDYGVNESTISRIRAGTTWSNIT